MEGNNSEIEDNLKELETLHQRDEDERKYVKGIPDLLLKTFGFDGKRCWVSESSKDLPTCQSLMKLLNPHGPLFALIIKHSDYQRGSVEYVTFPQDHLSLSSRAIVSSKRLKQDPSFPYYAENLSQGSENGMIRLDLFEYFMFLFAEFIVFKKYRFVISHSKMQVVKDSIKALNPVTYMKDWVKNSRKGVMQRRLESHKSYVDPYRRLLQHYLNFFYPMYKDEEPVLDEGGSRSPSRWRKGGRGKRDYYRRNPHHNRNFHDLKVRFLHIITDFWLCNWVEEDRICTFNQSLHTRSELILGSIIAVIKHFLCSPELRKRANTILRGFGSGSGSPSRIQRMVTPQRDRRLSPGSGGRFTGRGTSSSLPRPLTFPLEFLRVHIFRFLKCMFTKFPRKGRMPLVGCIHCWMTYIQPWEVFDDNDVGRWVPYIVCNWVMYSTIFIDFLSFVNQTFGEASTRDILKIEEVLNFFAEDQVLGLIRHVDDFLDKSKRGEDIMGDTRYGMSLGNARNRGMRYLVNESEMLTDHLRECLGSRHHYRAILSTENRKLAKKMFLTCMGSAKQVGRGRATRDGQSPIKKMIFGRPGKKRGDPRKGMQRIAHCLSKIFRLREEGNEFSPIRGKKLDFGSAKKKGEVEGEEEEFVEKGKGGVGMTKSFSGRPKKREDDDRLGDGAGRGWNMGPHRYDTDLILTKKGQMELLKGERICRNYDVKIQGNKVMLPARPSEIRCLVPPLQILSRRIDKWARRSNLIPINRIVTIKRINLRFLALKIWWYYALFLGPILYWIFYY